MSDFDVKDIIWTQYGEDLSPDDWNVINDQEWYEYGFGYFIGSAGDIIGPDRCGYGHFLPHYILPGNNKHEYVMFMGKKTYVSRLVCMAFKQNPGDDVDNLVVRHLNDDPSDNDVSNLAYGSMADNYADMVRNGHQYVVPVVSLDRYGNEEHFSSVRDAAIANNVSKGAISSCASGETHLCNGKKWRYENDDYHDKRPFDDIEDYRSERAKQVYSIDENGIKEVYNSIGEAAEANGVTISSVSQNLAGRTHKCNNKIFHYAS